MSDSNLILVLLLLASASKVSDSIRFEVKTGDSKCMLEEIKANTLTVGRYHVLVPEEGETVSNDYRITAKVMSPRGSNYHHEILVHSGQFAFTASQEGSYLACFYVPDLDNPMTVTIDFDWKVGVAAQDWSSIAKKGQLNVMQLELKKMFETVTSIRNEMYYLREREEEMQNLNRSTASTMINLGYVSLVICLSVAGLQFWHLKTYFQRKKLL